MIFIFVAFSFLISCGNGTDNTHNDSFNADTNNVTAATGNIPEQPTYDSSIVVEVKTFEVSEMDQTKHGWGYDLYVNGKRTIRQPIIPAVPGNDAFASDADAKKIGDLAAWKMKSTGAFPTINIHDLDSLGIKHQ